MLHPTTFLTPSQNTLRRALGRIPLNYTGQDFAAAGLFLFFVATTISFATTTYASRMVIEVLRALSLAGMVICISFNLLLFARLRLTTLFASLAMALLVIYGLLLAAFNGGLHTSFEGLALDLLIIAAGIIAFSIQDGAIISRGMAIKLLWYSVFMLLLTAVSGGIRLSVPPEFNFEYLSMVQEGLVRYSQGMSKFFGISAVCAIFLAFERQDVMGRSLLYLLALLFVLLSFLGGSRGDSLAVAVMLLGYTLYKAPHYTIYVAAVAVFLPAVLSRVVALEDITIISRLLALKDNLGMRDVLLNDVVNLLKSRPDCLISGCGYDYFQSHFNYAAGLYPHNYIAESIVVFGLPLTASLFYAAFFGVLIFRRANSSAPDAIPMIFVFYIIIGLKGGSLTSDWFLTVSLIYFAAIGILYPYAKSMRRIRLARILS